MPFRIPAVPTRASLIAIAVAGLSSHPLHAQGQQAASTVPMASASAASDVRLAPVSVVGNYDTGVGTTDAASAGTVNAALIERRPALRPAEVLEFVPGVVVTQHSGEGKANQYFLRGFNLDHGTDFATWLDGMPVNMPTHAHGHGYTDLNFLIPEVVRRLRYRKGPYEAEESDFASAGSARIDLLDSLPRGIASVTLGQDRYGRALLADSNRAEWGPSGGNWLYALDYQHNDGPWDRRQKHHRTNALLRYSFGDASQRTSVTAMGSSAGWYATDQIPSRAVADGSLGRFAAVDPSDGGRSERQSLSVRSERTLSDGAFRIDAYAIRSRLQLFSNFTYFLENPIDGDQFEQAERRTVLGASAQRDWVLRLGGMDTRTTVGVQIRRDRLDPVGLYATRARERTAVTQESDVTQSSAGLWFEHETQWQTWLRSKVGFRADRFRFDVGSSVPGNTGSTKAGIGSPKLALVFGPWAKSEFFVNYGHGYHSNDARGTVATVAAKSGDPVSRVTPLARSKGGELGLRTEAVPGLESSLALWWLRIGSELVFVGDAGETEPSRPSRRRGIEWTNHWRATPWLQLDADFSFSRARFADADPIGDRIPGSIDRVVAAGVSVVDAGPWFGHVQLRHFGPRPLVEDGSVRSRSTTLAYLRAGYRVSRNVELALDVFNVFDRKASDIDYHYTSRLQGEPSAGVDDVHFHPVEPRRVRLTLRADF
jgi:hypothetical protein